MMILSVPLADAHLRARPLASAGVAANFQSKCWCSELIEQPLYLGYARLKAYPNNAFLLFIA